MAHGVRAANRIGLAEQVVREPNLGVGIGPSELGERGAGTRADLVDADAEHAREVVVALPRSRMSWSIAR